jgi:D-3-phosphoglycerate dehydrogenase
VTHSVLIGTRSFGSTSQEPWNLLAESGCTYQVIDIAEATDEELAEAMRDADAFIVGKRAITGDLINASPNLKVICMHGTGVDHIDLVAAKARHVIVANCPEANTNGVAELTIALMLAVARQLPQSADALRHGNWGKWSGTELRGKLLGIVGVGRIGCKVAALATGFGMEILGHDPYLPSSGRPEGVTMMPQLDGLVERADFVSLHIPATAETYHLMNKRTLALMKPTAYLINTARGELVEEAALVDVLKDNRIAGAAVDVFADEPPGDNPLLALPNLVATPHIGAHSAEAIAAASLTSVQNVLQVLRTGEPLYRVV